VIDQRDAAQVDEIQDLGLACCATDSLMVNADVAQALAETALDLAEAGT
jgi:hypothetical protein